MKMLNKPLKLLIPFTLITLLSACNTDSKIFSNEFVGEWKSTTCKEGTNGHSFEQNWIIFDQNVGSLKNVIKIWEQPNCPTEVAFTSITVKSALIIPNDSSIQVSATCKDGKAKPTRLRFVSYADNSQTIVATTSTQQDVQDAIRSTLLTKNIGNVMPEYNLFCLDTAGKLHTGDMNTGNGLTLDAQPTEVDATNSFTKQ